MFRDSALIFTLMVGTCSAVLADVGHDDIVIGADGLGTGVLMAEFDFDHPVLLAPTTGLYPGWSGTSPGFNALTEDEPEEGFYQLTGNPSILLEIVAIDAALYVDGYNAVGHQFTLGGADVHDHLSWLIYSDDPQFDTNQAVWNLSFKLVDSTNTYASSGVYQLSFTNQATAIPEPAALVLALPAAALMLGRRRQGR